MTLPTDPIEGPQVIVHHGQIYRRAFGDGRWFFITPAEAEALAAHFEATPSTHWAHAHERDFASQLRAAIQEQSQHNPRRDAA